MAPVTIVAGAIFEDNSLADIWTIVVSHPGPLDDRTAWLTKHVATFKGRRLVGAFDELMNLSRVRFAFDDDEAAERAAVDLRNRVDLQVDGPTCP